MAGKGVAIQRSIDFVVAGMNAAAKPEEGSLQSFHPDKDKNRHHCQ